jgi:nucleoside-diphosphate-sugar epimerase
VHPVDHGPDVEQIKADPHFTEPLTEALAGREFDVAVASYGRLAVIAEVLAGRVGRLLCAGGFASYRGWHDPAANYPAGLVLPTPEDAPKITDKAENRFAALIAAAEEAVFRHHPTAAIFRYPYVYGPRQVSPREWSIVRRVLDGRRTMLVTDGGQLLITHGYAENLAHALMLALEQPDRSAGKAYNCGDLEQYTEGQIVEIAGRALGVELDWVSLPNTPKGRSLATLQNTHHRLMDLSQIRADLGYTDPTPAVEAIERTVRWYRDHPLERGGDVERLMMDKFNYEAEDRVIALARAFVSDVEAASGEAADFVHPYAHPKAAGAGRDERGR